MKDYECSVCGYIYTPKNNNNIEFKDLDPSWLCPVCSAKKEEFFEVS